MSLRKAAETRRPCEVTTILVELGSDLTLGLGRWKDLKDQDVAEPLEKEKSGKNESKHVSLLLMPLIFPGLFRNISIEKSL